MAKRKQASGPAGEAPLYGYNTKKHGSIVQQQIHLAKHSVANQKALRNSLKTAIAAETARINTLAANPANMYTESDRIGAISAATEKLKRYHSKNKQVYFDYNASGGRSNIDNIGPGSAMKNLMKHAKMNKKRYID